MDSQNQHVSLNHGMDNYNGNTFGDNLKSARQRADMTQQALAKAAKMPRLRIVRIESGSQTAKLDEALRLAASLKVPLERLVTGNWQPSSDLRGLALELYQLGLRDLEVSKPRVPGAFRTPEEVIAAVLQGDRPEPRVVEALPFMLAQNKLNVPLVTAFADIYDARIRTRLAWLSDITLTLDRTGTFASAMKSASQLDLLKKAAPVPEPDSLGHPTKDNLPTIWKRWNITYAGTLATFKTRIQEVQTAYQQSETSSENYG